MKRRLILCSTPLLCVFGALAASGIAFQYVNSQEPAALNQSPADPNTERSRPDLRLAPEEYARWIQNASGNFTRGRNPGSPELQRAIQLGILKLKAAKSEQDRAKAAEPVKQALEKYFDEDMKHRATQLASLEKRVQRLREHLEKRRSLKEEIVGLQMKVIDYEAKGLGLFPRARSYSGASAYDDVLLRSILNGLPAQPKAKQ